MDYADLYAFLQSSRLAGWLTTLPAQLEHFGQENSHGNQPKLQAVSESLR